jgi:hypothetical protein
MHMLRPSEGASRFLILFACLLIGIRLTADLICATCFNEIETSTSRAFYLHGGIDRDRCHHGKPAGSPLTRWACSVKQDDQAFLLPEVPRLSFVVSAVALVAPIQVSYLNVSTITAHGRGPPRFSA